MPLYLLERDSVPIVQEVVRAPEPVWTGAENLSPTGIFFCSLPVLCPYFFVLIFLAFACYLYSTTQTFMPPVEFEPATPTSDRLEILALDRSAIGFDPRTVQPVASRYSD